jgi:hypothetical protein
MARATIASGESLTGKAQPGNVGRNRRFGDDGFLAFARHHDPRGVEQRARRALAVAIDRIAQQRRAQAGQRVDAHLVGAAGFQAEFHQRAARQARQHAPVGDRRLALFAAIMRQPAAALEIFDRLSAIAGGAFHLSATTPQ